MSKIITIDSSGLVHRAIFSWNVQNKLKKQGKMKMVLPSSYNYFQMLIGILKRIGVEKDDTIIIAGDGRNSWRKAFYPEYKAQRKAFRESYEDIDWTYHYGIIGKVLDQLKESTNWNVVWLSKCFNYCDLYFTKEGDKFLTEEKIPDWDMEFGIEADDVMAYACQYFKDKEVVVVTGDADLEQLAVYSNTKIFTMNVKYKGGRGVYKVIPNGYKILEKKIRLGDVSDNILPGRTDEGTENDAKIRELIIDLIHLPEFVTEPIKEAFESMKPNELDLNGLPFPKSLAKRFPQIYTEAHIITYEDCIKRAEKKKKQASQKRKQKKLEKEESLRS